MAIGETLMRWSVRGALALYVLTWLLNLLCQGRAMLARGLWTGGCILLLIHVGLAFEVAHHWSHAEAYLETARQTAALTGINWGGGLYFNYTMLAAWSLDLVWWWGNPRNYTVRHPVISWGVQFFFAFMWFNATVVFGHGLIRWAGLAGFGLLAVGWWQSKRRANAQANGFNL